MSELKRLHINEVMDMHALTRGKMGYSQVYYADDVDRVFEKLKARIHELENIPHTDNSATVELLEKENAQLKESRQAWIARAGVAEENLAKLEKELAELREATRWRKVSDELPTDETEVPVILSNDWRTTDYYEKDKGQWHYHGSYVSYWFNVPKAPE